MGDWKKSLVAVLRAHNGVKDGGSVAGYATQDKRRDVLFAGFAELRKLGYKLDAVTQFKGRHMAALAKAWQERDLKPATIQNNLSIFRTFAGWIGKPGMIEGSEKYVPPGAASRSTINRRDKSWTSCGVDFTAKIEQVQAVDARVALQLELERVFGLRANEAWQLRPHISDKGAYLAVTLGTKGGRARTTPVDTAEKRELLDRAKRFAASRTASTSDPAKTLAQIKNHYYWVMETCGITKRASGVTSHGLRHEYVNDRYEEETGVASPVRGGSRVDRDADRAARLVIAEEVGHSREDVTTHYLGR